MIAYWPIDVHDREVSPKMAKEPAKVLLVESEPALRELEDQVLSDAGYQVQELPDDGDPVAFADQMAPQVIVLSIGPAAPDDWQIIDRLQSNPNTRAIPVVVISTSRRKAANAAASTNVSEAVVAPYDIDSLETAVATALGKPPAAASLPLPTHPVPAYQIVAADALQQASRSLVIRAVVQLLQPGPHRDSFKEITPELVDNLGLLLGAVVEGLRRDLSPAQVFAASAVQKAIQNHVRLRKSQGFDLATVLRESQLLENQVDRFIHGSIGASLSAADALIVVDKVHNYMHALVLDEVAKFDNSPADKPDQ